MGTGQLFEHAGDYRSAIADYSQIIRYNPNDGVAYFSRGNAYRAQGRPDLALSDYDRALEIDQAYIAAYAARARIHKTWTMPAPP